MTDGGHGLGSSMSRVVGSTLDDAVTVLAVDAASVFSDEPARLCRLLKIDIEGSEYDVVPRIDAFLRTARPPMLLSLHGYDLIAGHGKRGSRWLPGLRLRQARRRGRVFRTVRVYDEVRVHDTHAGDEDWRTLTAVDRLTMRFRLSEVELFCR